MCGELLTLRSNAEITHIPYKGSGPAMADLVAGEVQMAFSTITAALPFVKDNRIRALATSGSKRSPVFPDLPTVAAWASEAAGSPGVRSARLRARWPGTAPCVEGRAPGRKGFRLRRLRRRTPGRLYCNGGR